MQDDAARQMQGFYKELALELAAVGNEQFLRWMIPHHSGAVLMCEQSE